MTIEITFEYHSTSTDNEDGVASGWRDPPLSPEGREQAKQLRDRRREERIDAVFPSDLRRAVETAEIAFGDRIPIHPDSRLREYDYGTLTAAPVDQIRAERLARVNKPFPEGESLRDVADRVQEFLHDLALDWDGKRVVVVGHSATKLALDHLLGGLSLEDTVSQPSTRLPIPPSYRYVLEA